MNDAEIRSALSTIDDEVELRADRMAAARIAMLAELDRVIGKPRATLLTPVPRRQLRRWGVLLTAAATVVALVVGVAMLRSGDGTSPLADDVAAPENYLRSCVDFQTATQQDGADWHEVLSTLEREGYDDLVYRSVLAAELDDLARAPRADSFASDLGDVANDLRNGAALDGIIGRLQEIEKASTRAAGLDCLR